MTATSIVCRECGSPVPYGRLSCPSCGELLASVAGARPPGAPVTTPAAPASPSRSAPPAKAVPAAAAVPTAVRTPAATAKPAAATVKPPAPDASGTPAPAAAPATSSRRSRVSQTFGRPAKTREPVSAPVPVVEPNPVEIEPAPTPLEFEAAPSPSQAAPVPAAPAPVRATPPVLGDWPVGEPTAEPGPTTPGAPTPDVTAPVPDVPTSAPAAPAPAPVSAAVAGPTPSTAGVAWPPAAWPADEARPRPAASVPRPPAPTGAVAGAYLAPSATYTAGGPRPAMPTIPPEPVNAPVTTAATASATGRRGMALPAELAEWLSIGGSVLVIVSFVLPWATDGVIGSRGSGYTSDWGLANPGHLVLILATLTILVLHIVPNRVPRWVRSGVLPLLVGGVLLGLAFAYYARPFGGGTGVAVELAGALVLVGGGLLGIPPERNEPTTPGV